MNKLIAILYILILTAGCAQQPPETISPSEAHKKLVHILQSENKLSITTKEFEHTLWVYLPLEEGFLKLKAKKEPVAGPSSTPTTSTIIHFLEGKFEDWNFKIRYDIGPSKAYAKDPGYASTFSEDYQIKQQSILTAISRAYSDFESISGEDQLVQRVPGDVDFVGKMKNTDHKRMVHSYVKTDKAPNIFVIVMADITNGLESRILLHLKDLKRGSTDQTFYEEYAKRVISDQPFGNPAIVGDKTGRHVDFHDITMAEFLAKQIVYRINFKYTRSSFPPTEPPKETILKTVVEATDAYDFKGFTSVELRDLGDGTAYSISKDELAEYKEKPPEGRLIHIQFK